MTQAFSYSWKQESSEQVSWGKLQFVSPERVKNVGMHSTPPKPSGSICDSLQQPYCHCHTHTSVLLPFSLLIHEMLSFSNPSQIYYDRATS